MASDGWGYEQPSRAARDGEWGKQGRPSRRKQAPGAWRVRSEKGKLQKSEVRHTARTHEEGGREEEGMDPFQKAFEPEALRSASQRSKAFFH